MSDELGQAKPWEGGEVMTCPEVFAYVGIAAAFAAIVWAVREW